MLPLHTRDSLFRHAFPFSLAVMSLLVVGTGCSGGSEKGSQQAAAPKASAPAGDRQAKPAVPAAPAQVASGAPEASPEAAQAAAAIPAGSAPAAPDAAAPDAAAPGEGKTGEGKAAAGAETKPAAGLASSGGKISPETKAALEKAQAAARIGDPVAPAADPNSKAKLTYEFGSDTKNFGKCMQGDVLTHTFNLQSSGEEDLVIKQAKPTCGCTLAQVATQQADGSMAPYNFGAPIPPGRKVELTATLQTQNKRGHAASRINIFSNDPRGQTQLGLEAEVDPFFTVTPQQLNFNTLSARGSATDKVTIATTRGEKVKLTANLDNAPQGVKLEVTPSDPDAEGKSGRWELVANLGPGLVEGNLAHTVSLRSDIPIPGSEKLPSGSSATYEVSVPVMARVTGMISYSPAFVSLGLIRPGQVVSRTVRVTSHDPEFKLTEPKVLIQGRDGAEWELAPRFSTVIRPVAAAAASDENSIDVELRLDGMPETLNGSFSGTLVIQVGHPEKPEIKLPITGVCRGGAVAAAPIATPTSQPNTTPPK